MHTPRRPDESTRAIRRNALRFAPLLVFCLTYASDAMAYLDPGTGSILLQGLIATVAAAITWSSLYWRRTKAWFKSVFGRAGGGDDTDGQAPH